MATNYIAYCIRVYSHVLFACYLAFFYDILHVFL